MYTLVGGSSGSIMRQSPVLFALVAALAPASLALRPALRSPPAAFVGRPAGAQPVLSRGAQPVLSASAKKPTGTASLSSSSINLVKTIVGSGVLSLPVGLAAFSASRTAVYPALALMGIIGAISAYCFFLVARVCEATGSTTWSEAWSASVGEGSAWTPSFFVGLLCFSASLQYTMILGDSFSSIFTATGLPKLISSRTGAIALITALGTLPLSLLPSLEKLKLTSSLGIGGIVYTTAFMISRCLSGAYGAGSSLSEAVAPALRPAFDKVQSTAAQSFSTALRSSKVFILVSVMATSFCSHFLAPQFAANLDQAGEPSKTGRLAALTSIGFVLAAALSALVMVAGFLTFGSASDGFILNNYAATDRLAQAARLAIGGSIVCTYPLLHQGLRDTLMETLGTARVPTTLAAVGVVTAIGAALTNLGIVAAVSGAFISTSIVYTLPSLMWAGLLGKRRAANGGLTRSEKLELLASRLITVLGLGLAVVGMRAAF